LGNILRDRGRPVEAETRYAEALTTRKKLAADFNTRPELQMDLAGSHNDLGRHYLERGRLEEAEKAYKEALAIQKQLVANYPARPEFRRELALFHNNLGNLLRKSGRLEGAETSFTDALALYKQLAADFPARAEFCHDIATSQNNLGLLLMGTGRPNDAEVALINALAFYKQLPADYANRATVRNQIAGSLVNLALLNMKRGEFMMAKTFLGEALPHHNAALKANPRHPDFRSFYRQNLYISVLVHASLQDQPAAIRAAVLIHDLGWEPPTDAFSAASLLSRCIARVQDDNKESTGERKRAAILYGDEAMKMLRDALTKGFKGIEHMKYDYDLTPLRNRPDFQKLLADLEKANPADPKK
jgi:tetratricopeptide (TPR) repeat protein